MSRIRQTSLMAYREIEADGTMGKQAMKIYKYLKFTLEGYTRNELSRFLNIPINAVCGRVNELLQAEWIVEIGKKKDKFTNKQNLVVMAKCNI